MLVIEFAFFVHFSLKFHISVKSISFYSANANLITLLII
ncbi:hypothetical protein Patl1_29962 [Pistacia atlantica]|uniref:Uncharacterized protein n=1 Tax=Pistacia atlantica TaxID=434234 RepID=A0ACC1ABT8_9ROSI|nr:hypothetical protein Patl1_29962 [Pistacia atlantica]